MSSEPLRILVVDDHQLFREAIVSQLQLEDGMEVVGQVDNGVDTLLLAQQLRPDIILLDISLEGMDGLETTRLLAANEIAAKVLILSMHGDRQHISDALQAGVWGYVRKQEAFDDLVNAIRALQANQRYFSPALNVDPKTIKLGRPSKDKQLTERETEIVVLIAKGIPSQQIAEMMGLSVKTIETHRANINRKLETRNAADITRYAIRQGLITP